MKSLLRLAALAAGMLSFAVQAQNISIATGGTGGVYYPMGGGIAAVLSKHVPGMQATAEVTGGSVDNLKLDRHRQALHRLDHGRRQRRTPTRARTSSRATRCRCAR